MKLRTPSSSRLQKAGQVKFAERDDYRWPCVKATTVLHCDAKKAMDLLLDSSQTQQYNLYSIGRTDIETLSTRTKFVWNRTTIPFSVKPFDYCTLLLTTIITVSNIQSHRIRMKVLPEALPPPPCTVVMRQRKNWYYYRDTSNIP